MNERLLKLATEVGISVDYLTNTKQIVLLEKFAELIVRECVTQLELVRKYRYDRIQPLETQQTIIDECQYQIKQHFGVEE